MKSGEGSREVCLHCKKRIYNASIAVIRANFYENDKHTDRYITLCRECFRKILPYLSKGHV
jgi:hypothetical protein